MKKNADTTWQKSMHLKTTLINPKIQCIIIIKEASEETLKLLNHDEQDLSFICGRIESDVTKNTLARKNLRNNENYNQSSWICKNHSASLSRSHIETGEHGRKKWYSAYAKAIQFEKKVQWAMIITLVRRRSEILQEIVCCEEINNQWSQYHIDLHGRSINNTSKNFLNM